MMPCRARRRVPNRRGFTIVEMVVSTMIISVGILALAGGSAAVLRQMQLGNQYTNASFMVQSRMEMVRAIAACASMSGGSATTGNYSEAWTVTANARTNYKSVSDTVSYKTRTGGRRKVGVTAVVPCT